MTAWATRHGREAAELGWIGFQPLEAVFALVGAGVIALARPGGRHVSNAGQRPGLAAPPPGVLVRPHGHIDARHVDPGI